MIVAIDGPAGAGKSTVTRKLADAVGFSHLDSGAFYRCYALKAKKLSADLENPQSIAELLEKTDFTVDFSFAPPKYEMDGEDVSSAIRSSEISELVVKVSQVAEVRFSVVDKLREVAATGNFVIEGRDIGSVVFPDAGVKFFLTASLSERARRRHAELLESGESVTIEFLEEQIGNRDKEDAGRSISPLTCPEDAVVVDSTSISLEQVVEKMTDVIKAHNGG
jgi:cytidylate kinase